MAEYVKLKDTIKETHPRQYEYCIGGWEYDEDRIWKPSKQGLGMGHVFDELNKLYGDGFIKYQEASKDTRRSIRRIESQRKGHRLSVPYGNL